MKSLISILGLFFKAFIKNDKRSRFKIADRIFNRIYPTYFIGEWGKICHDENEFIYWFKKMEGKNPHSFERKYTLKELIKLTDEIKGDTVELGVYYGASSYLIAQHGTRFNKSHHMLDSWEGLSKPSKEDGDYWSKNDLSSSLDHCKKNLLPIEKKFLVYYKGWIPMTLQKIPDNLFFSFIHFDLDLYEPTKHGLEFFYDRLNTGGMIVFDDYTFTTCPGVKLAVDEFFENKKENVILLPYQAFVIKK